MGVLEGWADWRKEGSTSSKIDKAQGSLDDYDAEAEYDKLANRNLYIYNYLGKSPEWEQKAPEYKAEKLKFSEEQMAGLSETLTGAEDEYGVLKFAELDKEEVKRRIAQAQSEDFVMDEEAERGDPYYGMYMSSQVAVPNPDRPAGYMSQDYGDDPPINVIDDEATKAQYIKNLEGVLADENPSYASYWSHSKGEFARAYRKMSGDLRDAASKSKENFMSAVKSQVSEQQGLLDEAQATKDKRVADAAARSEQYRKLFNLRNGSYM